MTGSGPEEAIDLDVVRAEIAEEVRRKRESGEIPADLERELDRAFARFVPVGTTGSDFEQVLARAERAAFIDVLVPVESARPGVRHLKRAQRKLLSWYFRYVTQQVGVALNEVTRGMRILGERVASVERRALPVGPDVLEAARAAGPAPDLSGWTTVVGDAVRGVTGRVLVCECAAGGLLAGLVGERVDAYGVEPVHAWAAQATRAGLEVRADDPWTHLPALGDGVVGAVVATGFVERLTPPEAIELCALLARVLGSGGVAVLVSADPAAWEQMCSPVERDLAPGRPIHVETWELLLKRVGFRDVHRLAVPAEGAGRYGIAATRGD